MNNSRITANIPAAAFGAFLRQPQEFDYCPKPVTAIPAYEKVLFTGLRRAYVGNWFHIMTPFLVR
jgi:hypothetical protein